MPDRFEFANDLSTLEDNNTGSDTQLLNQEQSSGLVNTLHQILKPFLLRRLKTDGNYLSRYFIFTRFLSLLFFAVLMDLPKKREYILYAPLTPKQKELYDAAINGTLREKLTASLNAMNGNDKGIYCIHDMTNDKTNTIARKR